MPLKTFPKIIKIDDVTFTLIGIIHYVADQSTSIGPYTAYTLYGDKWILFDDLLRKCVYVTEETIINLAICMYVKVETL